MGNESDRLVFEYLSRVGDVAQQRQLPSGDRIRLVGELRGEIERQRAAAGSPAAVRRILGRLGTPDEVVTAAGGAPRGGTGGDRARGGGTGGRPPAPEPSAPVVPPLPAGPPPAAAPPAPPAPPAPSEASAPPEPPEPSAGSGPSPGSGPSAGTPSAAEPPARAQRRPWFSAPGGDRDGRPWGAGARGGPSLPVQRTDEPAGKERAVEPPRRGLRRIVPRTRPEEPVRPGDDGPSPPHLAGTDELGPEGSQPDWWRLDDGPLGGADTVPGFVGGVEIPEILRPPREDDEEPDKDQATATPPTAPGDAADGPAAEKPRKGRGSRRKGSGGTAAGDAAPEPGAARRWSLLPRRRAAAAAAQRRWGSPLLLCAAALLVGGAALGNWWALGLGWVIAYVSRRLTPAESKGAVLVVPGLVVFGAIVWLWGRADGRWGEPLAQDAMSEAMADTWPVAVRVAAVASAVFIVWRSRRRR